MRKTKLLTILAMSFGLSLTVRAQMPVVHWTFDDNTATNRGSGGAAYDAVVSGAAAFTNGIVGGGLRCPGGGENHAAVPYTFGNAGTVAFWFKPTRFFNFNSLFDNSVDPNKWEMWIDSGANVRFRLTNGQGDITYSTLNSQNNGTNAWYHITLTWDSNAASDHVRFYVNGVERRRADITEWVTPGDTVYFGGHSPGNTPGEGVLDDVRIYDIALTAESVHSIHAEIAAHAPVVRLSLDETADNLGTGGAKYNAALIGDPIWTNGWNGMSQALALDGVDDYVSIPYRLSASGSVALWYYAPGPWHNINTVFDNSGGKNNYECWIDSHGGISFRPAEKDWPNLIQYALHDNHNRWYHIVGTWNVISKDIVLYLNGVERGRTVSTNGVPWPLAGTEFYIGGGHSGNEKGRGVASDLQIFETALTSNRVTEIYNEFGSRGGLVAYLPLDGAAEDVAGGNAVIVTGSPSFVKGQVSKGLAYESAVIPGDGGACVSISNALGSSVGTIAFWYYTRGPWYNWQPVLDNAIDSEWWEGWIYETGELAIRVSNRPGGGKVTCNLGDLRGPNNWYHIAFTWNLALGQTKLYVDGAWRSTAHLSETGWVDPDATLNIGSCQFNNKAAHGIWDEVRVYNRALTDVEIPALMEIPPPPPPRGTLIWLR